jgi:hypothetical protein
MNLPDVLLTAGMLLSISAGLATWMMRVHAKLAVIASQLDQLADKLDRAADEHQELWNLAAHHEARLACHDTELRHLAG